jgi:protein-tyrosine phosphatase
MKILFVCKGNVVRSFCADYFSNKFIKENKINDIEISSAGTEAGNYDLTPELKIYDELEIDFSKHKQRKLSKEIINENDLIISMDKYNQKFIKENFNVNSDLFNKFCYNKEEGIVNFHSEDEIKETILHIKNSIPLFLNNIKNNHKRL